MNLSDLTFENTRGCLLPRVSTGLHGEQYYRSSNLETFVNWKMEVLPKFGDCPVRIEKKTKTSSFEIILS